MKKLLLLLMIASPTLVSAGEINYPFVEGVRGNKEIHINYRGPSIDKHFACDANKGSCKSFSPDKTPFLITDHIRNMPLTVSPDGVYAVATVGIGQSRAYQLFSLARGFSFVASIPVRTDVAVSRIIISRDSEKVLFRGSSSLFLYDIAGESLKEVSVSTSGMTFFLLSPSGKFVSGYDEIKKEHRVIDLTTGKEARISSDIQNYFEISGNGEWGAYISEERDKHRMRIVDMRRFPKIAKTDSKTIDVKGSMVADFTFHKNELYFITNEDSPLSWSLFRYDPVEGKHVEIAQDVSYGDFMRGVGDRILYYTVDGKNSYVVLYDPSSRSHKRLTPVKGSRSNSRVVQKEIKLGKSTGVIVDTKDRNRRTRAPLVVWLHGGPRRQTSVGYHPYLSYAVYDELLERLTASGARVLKLDYTGSWGYGERFMEDLEGGVGIADVNDVAEAVEEFRDDYKTSEVYLLGNSYGGYLSVKALVENPLDIDGAVAINGVFDWRTLVARIPSTPFTVHFGGPPNTKTARAYEKADILPRLFELPKDTPVLVVYGKKDRTVPTWQSTEFVSVAKVLDKNIELVVYEEEDHILRERKTLNDLCKRVTSVFDLKSSACKN